MLTVPELKERRAEKARTLMAEDGHDLKAPIWSVRTVASPALSLGQGECTRANLLSPPAPHSQRTRAGHGWPFGRRFLGGCKGSLI